MSARLVVRMMVVLVVVLSFAGTVFGAATFGVNGESTLVGRTDWDLWGGENLAVVNTTVYASYNERNDSLDYANNYPVIARSLTSGDSWDVKSYVSTQSCGSLECWPRIAIGPRPTNGSQQILHVIWHDTGHNLYYSRAFPQDTDWRLGFSAAITVVESAGSMINDYSLAVDGSGNLHILYQYVNTFKSLRIKEDVSGNPVVEGPITVATSGALFSDITADSAGDSYTAIGGMIYKKNYSADYASTNWAATGVPYDGSYGTFAPNLVVKDSSTMLVADSMVSSYVSVTENGGASWTQHELSGWYPRMALEPSGSVVVVLESGDGTHNLKFSRGTRTNKWAFSNPSTVLGQGAYAEYPNIISLPGGTNKALILYMGYWYDAYSTKEQ